MRRRERIAVAAIALTVGFAALAIGAATRWTALAAAAMALGCGAVHLRARRQLVGWPPLLLLLGAAAALTALQLIPLPVSVLGALSGKLDLVAGNARALAEPAASAPLSYDAAATWLELAKLVGYAGFACCCTRVAASERGRVLLASIVAGAGAAVAAVTAVHELAGAGSVYGLYAPRYASDPVLVGPFLNPNHLAGVLALCCPVAIALAIHHGRDKVRLVWSGCAVLIAAVAFLSESRTGGLTLIIGVGVVVALAVPIWRQRRNRKRRPTTSNTIAIALLAGAAASVTIYAVGRGAIDELASTRVDELTGERGKVAVWLEAAELIPEHPWTGVGKGGFGFAIRSSDSGVSYSHAENAYLQVVLDWGVPAAALLALLLLLAVRAAVPRARESLIDAGLAAGLLAIMAHQIADFTLELPGAALPALIAFAVLTRVELERAPRRARHLRIAGLAVASAAIAAAASPLATPARSETDALARHFERRDPRGALDDAIATWRRHPGDFIAAAQVAEALFARGDRRAVAVINRALVLNPAHSGVHLIAARMLRTSQRPEQALVEYQAAIAGAADRLPIIRELIAAFPDPAVAARGLPVDRRQGHRTLTPLSRLDAASGDELGYHYTSRLVELYPDDRRFHRFRTGYALRVNRIDAAIESGRFAADGGGPVEMLLYARALDRRGDHAGVERVITELRDRRPVRNRAQVLAEARLLGRALGAQNKLEAAAAVLREAVKTAGIDNPDARPLYVELAVVQDKLGDTRGAADSRTRAKALK